MPNNGLHNVTGTLNLAPVSLGIVRKQQSSVQHGDLVTITGSGFGSNATSLEFIGGADGVLETTSIGVRPSKAGWQFGTQWAIPLIASDVTRGKVASATADRASTWQMDMRYDSGAPIGESQYVYWSWWVKANVVDPGTPALYQWKLGRLNFQDSISDSDTEITMFNWTNGSNKQLIVRRGGADTTSYYPTAAQTYPRNDEWCRMELFVYTGTAGNTDGAVHLVTNRPDGRYVYTLNNQKIYAAGNVNRLRHFVLQNYFGNFNNGGSTTTPVSVDDVACAIGSWKRVELADHADLSQATIREFQPHTAWATGSVSAKLNKGGLSSGTYWLHVVDGLNTALASKQVEII